jgi:hypothetical protein
MAIDLNFVNAALTRTGNDPITQLSDGTPGGNIAGQNYDQIVKALLTAYPWRWATKTATLVAISGTPDLPWLYAYQLPSDFLKLRVITADGYPMDYERQFTKIVCNIPNTSEVVAKYTWSVPEAYWPGTFAEAVTQHLEALFLRGVGERFEQGEARQKDAMMTLRAAKLEDAQNNSTINPVTSPTLAARGVTATSISALTARTG